MSHTPNHLLNARVRKLPECPECEAAFCAPCTTSSGQHREPHRSRERIAFGDLIVVRTEDARAAHKLRAIRELAATINPSRVLQRQKRTA